MPKIPQAVQILHNAGARNSVKGQAGTKFNAARGFKNLSRGRPGRLGRNLTEHLVRYLISAFGIDHKPNLVISCNGSYKKLSNCCHSTVVGTSLTSNLMIMGSNPAPQSAIYCALLKNRLQPREYTKCVFV